LLWRHDELDVALVVEVSQDQLLIILLCFDLEVGEWVLVCMVREVKDAVGHRDRPDAV